MPFISNETLAKITTIMIGLWIVSSFVLPDGLGSLVHTLLLFGLVLVLLYFMKREGLFDKIF